MDHQSEIDKRKYRNWVRGGLAYKYLKQGLEGFADDVVKKEHNRILAAVIHTPGNNCNHCCLRNLQPLHTCKRDHTGKKTCPYGLLYCNCLHGKKQRCPTNICDGIMEEILKSHGSLPPQPYWRNTDIQKWCTEPWEVAKCYINAPGYSDKTKAADIDIYGLLHVFINNTSLYSHLACSMTGSSNIFTKVRGRRNSIFHSPTMEMEDTELTECVDDIIAILEDTTELKMRKDAQQAVTNLNKIL
ncbi:uncharacterized protein CXorf38 homolog [Ruditapes philippinarum]|uniref:uncharacterized protein CXorf38 homolog n=1 Tax=Ruditapes philippinarum TaxID=129788 RepID=UPI00295B0793|nr:uncharacterized protein CXorf38 homolog [Ruditapes philippinarum]